MTRPPLVQDGEGLGQHLLVDPDVVLRAGGVGQQVEAYKPVYERFHVPQAERDAAAERIGVARLHKPRGRVLLRLEVTGLRFVTGERRGHHPCHLQHLVRCQVCRDDRGVPAATMRLGSYEIDERQGRRQGLYPVLGDVAGLRISAVG
jgi:hypothetical protein